MIQVRKATREDILGIQQVAHVTWHYTYEHIMRPDTRALVLAEFYSEESLACSLERKEIAFLVAEEAGRIIGFAQALPRPQSGYEVTRTYILPQYQRKGVGTQLNLPRAYPDRLFGYLLNEKTKVPWLFIGHKVSSNSANSNCQSTARRCLSSNCQDNKVRQHISSSNLRTTRK